MTNHQARDKMSLSHILTPGSEQSQSPSFFNDAYFKGFEQNPRPARPSLPSLRHQLSSDLVPYPTPGLVRSISEDSADTSAPSTPQLPHSPDAQWFNNSNSKEQERYEAAAALQAMGHPDEYLYNMQHHMRPSLVAPPSYHHQECRRSISPRSPGSTTGSQRSEKTGNRQYLCPMSAETGCRKFFTTSGHARRHSRTHTGQRSSTCPECGQCFSRQDNMQQHRRTHKNGRNVRAAATKVTAEA